VPVELALAHPHLSGGGFDLPVVEPIFSRYVASHGLSERLHFAPGDFFADNLPRADVLVMGLILHDWDLPTKRMLIGKAHAALRRCELSVLGTSLIGTSGKVRRGRRAAHAQALPSAAPRSIDLQC